MKLFEYQSNNSGGSYWLEKKDWDALEKSGWRLAGFGNIAFKEGNYDFDEKGLPKLKGKVVEPVYAYKHFESREEAEREFEELTGQSIDEEGCECCGSPHSIYEVYQRTI